MFWLGVGGAVVVIGLIVRALVNAATDPRNYGPRE